MGDVGSIVFHYGTSALRIVNTGHSLQLDVEEGSWVELDGKRYDLKQFHFHSPSEHTVDGEGFEMEAHFVHESADRLLAVVTFLIDAGPEAEHFDKLVDYAPGPGESREIPDFSADLTRILPGDLEHVFRYSGSLTTPPCSENVEWVVMKTHRTASPEQIAKFREHYAGNNRPVQPLNDRMVTVN